MKMPLGAKYKEVCVCFVCVQGETTPFHTVTMEFIIILMMLQLRQYLLVDSCVGGFFSLFSSCCISHHARWGFAVLLAHTCSDKQAVAAVVVQ